MTWKNKKQPIVARSSVEAENTDMALGVYRLLWLINSLADLDVDFHDATKLFVTLLQLLRLFIMKYNMIN